MNIDFEHKMSGETDEYLVNYINNRRQYVAEAIRAAVAELQRRGHVFEEAELEQIAKGLAEKNRIEEEQPLYKTDTPGAVAIDDLFARTPSYYSQQAVMAFSIFFGTIFGAVLMAINLKKDKTRSAMTILFGVTYLIVTGLCINSLPDVSATTARGLGFLFNGVGGALLSRVLWARYIGKDVEYRKKSIWIPLIICVVISIPVVIATLYFDTL